MSVVIPVRNGASTIGEQLDSLCCQSRDFSWELVVSDNGSTDGTAEVVLEHEITRLRPSRIVNASQRPGVNHARNIGVAASRAPLVAVCDSDDRVGPKWLESHFEALRRTKAAVSAGPLMVGALNTPSASARWPGLVAPSRFASFFAGYGANFAFHRELWVSIEGFDEEFKGGFDEIEFMIRAQKGGAAFIWAPEAIVHYRVPEARRSDWKRKRQHGRMQVMFGTKHSEFASPAQREIIKLICKDVALSVARIGSGAAAAPVLNRLNYRIGILSGIRSKSRRPI
jgi:glycosyltransferase involved in cell wall biosynthesis